MINLVETLPFLVQNLQGRIYKQASGAYVFIEEVKGTIYQISQQSTELINSSAMEFIAIPRKASEGISRFLVTGTYEPATQTIIVELN